MVRSKSNKWQDITKKYQGRALTEYLMMQYIKYGKYSKLGKEYGVAASVISDNIKKYIEEVKYDKPYLYELYEDKIRESKINNYSGKIFDLRLFQKLPKEMEYTKLLSILKDYNTKNITGNDVVNLAKQNSIKLYNIDLYSGAKKYIKF